MYLFNLPPTAWISRPPWAPGRESRSCCSPGPPPPRWWPGSRPGSSADQAAPVWRSARRRGRWSGSPRSSRWEASHWRSLYTAVTRPGGRTQRSAQTRDTRTCWGRAWGRGTRGTRRPPAGGSQRTAGPSWGCLTCRFVGRFWSWGPTGRRMGEARVEWI